MADLHRVRFTVDVIYDGPKLSPTAMRNVGREVSSLAHVVGFENVKNVSVVYTPKENRVVYAHHHDASSGYCQVKNGCITAAQDGLSQADLEEM